MTLVLTTFQVTCICINKEHGKLTVFDHWEAQTKLFNMPIALCDVRIHACLEYIFMPWEHR